MSRTKPLACGGKGPCCHIGYSHRHCEHCDVVIDTRPVNWWYWSYMQPATVRPYQPYWGTFGNASGNVFGGSHSQTTMLNATGADQSLNVQALPSPTTAHVCEVK